MFLAEVIGHVVATKKDDSMRGKKLFLLRPQLIDENNPAAFRNGVNTIVAVDNVGAGEGDLVMFCQGSSARQAAGLKMLACRRGYRRDHRQRRCPRQQSIQE